MTIMNRRIFRIKPGETLNALEILREEGSKVDFPGPVRIYHTLTGEFDQIIIEYEFPDLASYETFWNDWFASEVATEFMPRWRALNLPGGSNELYHLDTVL